MQLIFHMKRYKLMLDKFTARQKASGMPPKENPFEKIDFKEMVNIAQVTSDPQKLDKILQQAELKLEEFFESKKKYYKNLRKEQTFRTDAVAQQERLRDRTGDLTLKARQIEQKVVV